MEIPSKTAFFFGRCPLVNFSLFCKFSLFILQKKNSSLQDGRIGRGASAAADAPLPVYSNIRRGILKIRRICGILIL
jgi:hypothetical protein